MDSLIRLHEQDKLLKTGDAFPAEETEGEQAPKIQQIRRSPVL